HLQYEQQQRARKWHNLKQPLASEVQIGLMGLGELGRASADLLHQLGFGLRGWSRTSKELDNVACFHGADGLDAFLSETDILVCLLPLTPDTEGLIGTALFEKLRRDGALGGPVFINAGRGRIHVESDIVAALQNDLLKAASLDVFEVEPLPQDSPLWNLENLIITPHVAAVSNPKALSHLIARQVRAHQEGRELDYLVDVTRGY
ncbi:MAG: NAD(P)-dependent oxidoreductase, partial [Hyphomicrobiales bacterium]